METVAERFLRYVAFDTQSDELSETCPSTEKQKALGQQLVEDMKAMGIADARMDENGYVYGTFCNKFDCIKFSIIIILSYFI